MRKLAVAFAVVVIGTLGFAQSCSETTTTAPTTVMDQGPAAPVASSGAVPTPLPTADPGQDLSYVRFNEDGSGEFCALAKGGKTAYLSYTKVLETDPVYGTLAISAEIGKCAPIPPAKEIVKACGKVDVQIDANQDGFQAGRHIGHKIVLGLEATLTCCVEKWEEQEPEITYGEWGTCAKDGEKCYQSRTVKTVIKEKNSCTGAVRVKSDTTATEKRECECACVPEWKELEPEITYGEWGECKKDETCVPPVLTCSQTRTKTTVIKEQNTCTKEIREKSRKTDTESRPCECVCVPVWEESTKVTYTEWGACEKQRDGSCARYRNKITEIWHTNSCTKETKLYKTLTEREFASCECPVVLLGYCHVSNKGHDHEINLVVSFKKAGTGHELHADPLKFCPADWAVYGALEADYGYRPSPDECKVEGGPDSDKYCSCAGLIERTRECSLPFPPE